MPFGYYDSRDDVPKMPEIYMQCRFCVRHYEPEQLFAANKDAKTDDCLSCPYCLNSTFEVRLM